MVTERQNPLVQLRVVGDKHAAFASGERLGPVKREDAKCPYGTGARAAIHGTDGLSCVLDHRDSVLLTNGRQAVHVTQVAIEMNGDNRLGSRRDGLLDQSWVEAPGILENIDKYGFGAQMDDRGCRGDPIGVCQNDFVARSDIQRRHAHMERARAARSGDGIFHTEVGFEQVFKAEDIFVALLAPTICSRIGRVLNLEIGDGWLGVEDAVSQKTSNLGTAVTKRTPRSINSTFCCLTSAAMFHGRINT